MPDQAIIDARAVNSADLMARAAWLHFTGGLTQSEVAKRLNIPNTRAHRYIAQAQRDGIVRVFVDAAASVCIELETRIQERFGLEMCTVAMHVPEAGPIPLRSLSVKGADFLMHQLSNGLHEVIGIGHGRTLAAAVDAIGRVSAEKTKFVSVLGGLTRSFAANPYDVIHKLNQRIGSETYMLPAPIYADSANDKKVLMAQSGLNAAMRLIDAATLFVVGIGALPITQEGRSSSAFEYIGIEEAETLYRNGARAEILGRFIAADGTLIETTLHERVMSPGFDRLRGRKVIAIAGGLQKIDAIRATLRSGLLTGLIVDEATARGIVEQSESQRGS